MKVYLVTSGSYSDYTVEAVFADREDAEKVVDAEGGSLKDWFVEEHDLIDHPVEWTFVYRRGISYDGEPYLHIDHVWPWDMDVDPVTVSGEGGKWPMVWGTDKELVDQEWERIT